MLNLMELPAFYLGKYGIERVAETVGKSTSLVSMWSRRGKFPLDAVNRLLEFDPEPLAKIQPLYPPTTAGGKLIILMPLSGPPEPKTFDCIMRLYDKREMAFERFSFNSLTVARNTLAGHFLRGPWEWSYWSDGDNIVPCGDSSWYRDAAELPDMPDAYAGFNSIYRMLYHKKSIVSCAYMGRKKGVPPQFGGDVTANRAEMRRGPQNRLIERPWAGMGGVLIHRKVFEDIAAKLPDETRLKGDSSIGKKFGYTHSFFHPLDLETPGDDLTFCDRARRAGHPTFVDLAVQSAHIGDRCYTYKDA